MYDFWWNVLTKKARVFWGRNDRLWWRMRLVSRNCWNMSTRIRWIIYATQVWKKYLCYDAVHLIKNVRNNLLKCKWFIFPQFEFSGFKDPINVPGGEIAWKSFHDVFERDASLHANLREAPKLTAKVLHPGNCKQNVPNALAIFDETTIAAVKSYFPEKAGKFLTLLSKWWVLSNSKARYSTANYLGNAAVTGDKKPSFLRAMTDWIQNWQEKKILNCEKFTLTSQTASAFVRTLKCHP